MGYRDFIKFISERTGEEKTYTDIENLIHYGISWCENGENERGEKTTLCVECQYYKECDVIYGVD